MPENKPPAPESRTPASARRRLRAIDAFIDLVLEGNLPPSPAQVAERAGISPATLFRYFNKLDDLRIDAGLRLVERFPLMRVPDPGKGTRRERIERFSAARVDLWEKVQLLARLQRTDVFRDAGAARMIDAVRGEMVDEIRHHFAPELEALTGAQREDVVALIATLTSVESWEQCRLAYGRSLPQTTRAWARAIDTMLGGHGEG